MVAKNTKNHSDIHDYQYLMSVDQLLVSLYTRCSPIMGENGIDKTAKFRGSGGFGAEKNEKRVERKKKDLRFFPCPGQASASAPYCS